MKSVFGYAWLFTLSVTLLILQTLATPVKDEQEPGGSTEDRLQYTPEEEQGLQLMEDDGRPKRFDAFMNGFGTAKRNFDEINRSSFGFNKRNFDEINRSSFGFNKRNFDEINRSSFGFNKKRNFDEINRSSFGFNKRNFDEINRSSFGFYNPSDYQLKAIRRSQKPTSTYGYFFPFFKRSQDFDKKNFDEISRSQFGFAG